MEQVHMAITWCRRSLMPKRENITHGLEHDTAKHYQWYPFINIGHYELAKQLKTEKSFPEAGYYKTL